MNYEWWMIALACAWGLAGFVPWVSVILRERKLTAGSLLMLPLCVVFGALTLLWYWIESGEDPVLWRW